MDPCGLSRRAILAASLAAGLSTLAGCKVVSIADREREAAKSAFNPKAWANALWAPKVLPYFEANAKPLDQVLAAIATDFDAAGTSLGYRPSAEGSPWTFVVTGTGTVVTVNTQSRAGTLAVALDGVEGGQPILVQIGPVIIGSAIRDALPFVNFKDFTNQLEFADAGKALTALALAGIAPTLPTIRQGSKIRFSGALSMTSKADPIKITPVLLSVQS